MQKLVKFPKPRGPKRQDIITRDELELMVRLQAEAWQAERLAHKRFAELEQRMQLGASVEECEYYLDTSLKMVRNRNAQNTCALSKQE
jgi:hypothetical protein